MSATAEATRPIVLASADLPRPEWLAVRRRGIGSSDIAGIAGLSTFASPISVYLDKLGELPDDDMSEAAEWGLLLEDAIAQQFARKTGIEVRPSPGVLAHPERTWQLANLDRLLGDGSFLEVKTVNAYRAGDWPVDDDGHADFDTLPDRVALQVAHQLDVTGADHAYVAALIGGQTYRQFRVERDQELCEMVRRLGEDFWQRVLDRRPPPLDGSAVTADLLGRLYEVNPDSITVLDPSEFEPLRAARDAAKDAEKVTHEARVALDNQIKALLGEHEIGVIDGRPVVTWKQSQRAGYQVQPTTVRTLRFPKAGK